MKVTLNNLAVSLLVGASVCGLLIGNSNASASANTYRQSASPNIALASTETTDTLPVVAPEVIVPKPKPALLEEASISKFDTLDEWLDAVAQRESNNQDNLKVLDVNGKYSYGCMQFQMSTFQQYMEKFNLMSELSLNGWEATMYNCGIEKQLAKLMIENDPGAWKQWYNSTKAIGLPPSTSSLALK